MSTCVSFPLHPSSTYTLLLVILCFFFFLYILLTSLVWPWHTTRQSTGITINITILATFCLTLPYVFGHMPQLRFISKFSVSASTKIVCVCCLNKSSCHSIRAYRRTIVITCVLHERNRADNVIYILSLSLHSAAPWYHGNEKLLFLLLLFSIENFIRVFQYDGSWRSTVSCCH